jgi:autotransporter-associated beta strand protein
LFADSRVDMYGQRSGGGTLTLFVPYVRTTLFGDWSAFSGRLNVVTDAGGGEFRIANTAGFPNARVHVADNILMYSRASSGAIIPIGEFSADSGATVSAGFGSSAGTQNAVRWRVGGLNTDCTNAATFAGTVSFIKEGTGIWTLTGDGSHTGTTTVSEGTLRVDGDHSAASGSVGVAASATLSGNGIVGGSVSCSGTIAPGASLGILTVNNSVALGSGATALMEISANPPGQDLLNVVGTLTYGGMLKVINTSGPLFSGASFKIFDAGSYQGAFATLNLPPLSPGLAWDTSALSSSGTLSVTGTNPPAPPQLTPPAAHYRFDGDAQDSSGNGNHGTPSAVSYSAGRIGAQAVQLNGATAYVKVPRSIGSSDFTIALWLRTTDTGGSGGANEWWRGDGLVDGEVAGSRPDFGTSLVGSKFTFGVGFSPDVSIRSTTSVNDGQWHHLAATRELAAGLMKVYVDGNLEDSVTGPAGVRDAPENLHIGSLQTTNNYLNGAIDDVRLYDSLLSPEEIAFLAGGGPRITGIEASGSEVIVTGDGGLPAGAYQVLTSGDIVSPLSLWSSIATNVCDGSGGFIFTNSVNAGSVQAFIAIEIP